MFLLVFCDDVNFLVEIFNNFFWVIFMCFNLSYDIYGVEVFIEFKYWGCRGLLIIDV